MAAREKSRDSAMIFAPRPRAPAYSHVTQNFSVACHHTVPDDTHFRYFFHPGGTAGSERKFYEFCEFRDSCESFYGAESAAVSVSTVRPH